MVRKRRENKNVVFLFNKVDRMPFKEIILKLEAIFFDWTIRILPVQTFKNCSRFVFKILPRLGSI